MLAGGGLVVAASVGDDAAGQDGVAGDLGEDIGLAGEQRLVDPERVGPDDDTVDDDLVAEGVATTTSPRTISSGSTRASMPSRRTLTWVRASTVMASRSAWPAGSEIIPMSALTSPSPTVVTASFH